MISLTIEVQSDIIEVLKFLHNNNPEFREQVFNYELKEGELEFLPYCGEMYFNHEGEEILIEVIKEDDKKMTTGHNIVYYSKLLLRARSLSLLKSFIKKVQEPETVNTNSITIRVVDRYGTVKNRVSAQPLEHIYLPGNTVNDVCGYVEDFINNKTKYEKFGKPHKLCILFEGIPGSGKTVLAKYIAMKFNRPYHYLSITSDTSDNDLRDMFRTTESNPIIVLEDFDRLFFNGDLKEGGSGFSISTLLNILDGGLSITEGSIVILTSNDVAKFDKALIRPGRINRVFKFGYARKREMEMAFEDMTGRPEDFETFYEKVKHKKLSMASLTSYLFEYEEGYMENLDELDRLLDDVSEFSNGNEGYYV